MNQEKFNKPIVTAISVAPEFYIAEDVSSHQDFTKTSMRYKMYAQARKLGKKTSFLKFVERLFPLYYQSSQIIFTFLCD